MMPGQCLGRQWLVGEFMYWCRTRQTLVLDGGKKIDDELAPPVKMARLEGHEEESNSVRAATDSDDWSNRNVRCHMLLCFIIINV